MTNYALTEDQIGPLCHLNIAFFRMISDSQNHLCSPCIKGVIEAHAVVNDRPQDSLP